MRRTAELVELRRKLVALPESRHKREGLAAVRRGMEFKDHDGPAFNAILAEAVGCIGQTHVRRRRRGGKKPLARSHRDD